MIPNGPGCCGPGQGLRSVTQAIVGQPEAPAIFEGFGLGTVGVPALLELVSAEARPDGSIFARYTVP